MALLGIVFVVTLMVWMMFVLAKKASAILDKVLALQGPAPLPFIGNLHQFHFKPDEFFEQAQGLAYMLEKDGSRMTRVWFGAWPWALLYGAEECESILGSNKILTKPFQYRFISPWIGNGLLLSESKKWRSRRKLLTPAFHYDILKDFVGIYNRHARTLLNKFEMMADGEYHEIFHTISLCTIDVICETALGIHVDAQKKRSPYLEAVAEVKYIVHQRTIKPHLYPTFIFNLLDKGRRQQKCIEVLHAFTSKAIKDRKKLADQAGGVAKLLAKENETGRRRMAFLDLMLDMHAKGDLPMEGIQEEVDTFTFEGHDTTSASMNWFLHLMGVHPEIQAKVHKEIDDVLGKEDRSITYEDLGNLRYLEASIKEALRLFPSVPIIARLLTEDTKIKNNVLPKGMGVVIIPSMVHRDPKYWPDPEIFNPERFIDSELKHPYSYIPFSAGSRNCIGQRFAMMEEKCVLAMLLRHLKVKSKLRTDQMRVSSELVIRPLFGNNIRFEKRSYGDYTSIA